jgi:4-diphosphocytidyl-2-C-methyl-D-erythritol kinase
MLLFPNCKINLGLNVVAKRTDGYHDLETVFFPISFNDALEAVQSFELQFQSTGLPIQGEQENNLCVKAYHLLKKDFPDLPLVNIHLHKVIPMGAGLGGGSSDGAHMLLLLNRKFQLQLSQAQLMQYALELGSDCPFFIINQPTFATGRGEIMSPVHVDLSAFKILLIKPGLHISTKNAFTGLTPKAPAKSIKEIIERPVETWKDELRNDFEQTIFLAHPTLRKMKEELYNQGAVYASMTGTGSTLFGIFNKQGLPNMGAFETYFTKWI